MQTTGAPHVAWFLHDEDRAWLERTERATRDWQGPIHPRVTQILSTGWHGEHVVVEIEDDRGPRLATAAQQLTDPVERERWVVAQFIAIGDGLATLRRRDPAYVHRRLEPDRLYVDVQGHARLRAPIPFVSYMSPEQVRGQEVTAASDVFALASNLYFALSGKRPFATESEFDTLTAILDQPPHPLETPAPGLARVLERAFAKDILAL